MIWWKLVITYPIPQDFSSGIYMYIYIHTERHTETDILEVYINIESCYELGSTKLSHIALK